MRGAPDLTFEQELWRAGLTRVAGMDEAGRGAMAGPVSVGVVILPATHPSLEQTLTGVRDSKQLTPLQRTRLAPLIQATSLAWSVAFASAEEIDDLGIVAAIKLAAVRALHSLTLVPDYLLTDYQLVPETDIPQTTLVKGDQRSLSIAAASILAKTARDALMIELDRHYPGYKLGKHKGYGTLAHRSTLSRLGRSPIHRQSFTFKEK